MNTMRKRLSALLLAFTMLFAVSPGFILSVSAVEQTNDITRAVCTHEVVNADGICANESCKSQALAKFVCADTIEYIFTASALMWKTINMNNNDVDDNYTITILSDIPSVSFTILDDIVTIDLNGFELGYTGGDFGNIVYLDESGCLTITDSSESKSGAMINPTGPVVDFSRAPNVESTAILNIEAGTFSGSGITFWLGGGTLYIKGGTVIGQYMAAAGAITGGCFTLDPSGDLTEEYEAVLEEEYYVVRKKNRITVPVTNAGNGSQVDVSAIVNDNTATVTNVELSELDSVVGDTATDGDIKIDFSALDTELVEVKIPTAVINEISDAISGNEDSFEIVFEENLSIKFDEASLGVIAEQSHGSESLAVSIRTADSEVATDAQMSVIDGCTAYDITLKSGNEMISNMGGKITINVPYELEADTDPDNVIVYYVDMSGNREKCETVYNRGSCCVSWETTHLSIYMIDDGEGSIDNEEDSIDCNWWYILMMLRNQEFDVVATSTAGGTITPAGVSKVKSDESITYTVTPDDGYAIADVLVNGESAGAVSEYTIKHIKKDHTIHAVFIKTAWENPFDDVSESDRFYEDVEYVCENGLMIGTNTEGTMFSPNETLTRAMVVTILWRIVGEPVVNYAMSFEDVAADQWYSEAIRWAASEKIVEGYGNGKFGINDTITREQLAVILYRYEKRLGGGFTEMWMYRMEYDDFAEVADWAYEAICWLTMKDIYITLEGEQLAPKEKATRAETAAFLHRFCEYRAGQE